jgi:serine/threonine-protein kinase HipA
MRSYLKEFAYLKRKKIAGMTKQVIVWISLGSENIPVGSLWFHLRNGKETASFEYTQIWLEHSERFALEPALQLTRGSYHTTAEMSVFGAIGDSAPDRWGRVLMRRAESKRAKAEKRTPVTLSNADYLLRVNDEARQGALRFSLELEQPVFLAEKEKSSIPPIIDLPKLLSATERFLDEDESAEDLKLLLAPGSSLGGARPKASIRDRDGSLAIAKFPRKDDEHNVVIWEAVALRLAELAGINVPDWRLETILKKPVLITKRFDRCACERIPFLSAMSMLGAKDNEEHSYLEIAYALIQNGSAPNQDLAELWKRIVFSIMISNTDDHLRNHGFLYERNRGWKLSPIYDINPTPIEIRPRILTTAIDYDNRAASLEIALKVIKEFRLNKRQANKIVKDIVRAVKQWRKIALSFGLSKKAVDRMASAFEHEDMNKVLI